MKKEAKKVKKVVKKHFKKMLLFPILTPVTIFLILFILFYFFWLKYLPSPIKLSQTSTSFSTQIYDRNGKLLYTLYSDRNQTFVPLRKIPKELQEATIAIEDRDFYHH